MRILVLLGVGADVRVPPQLDPRSGRVREEWLVGEVDAASARALEVALELKARPDAAADATGASPTDVTVVHLGPASSDPWLRAALARGADRAIRVWSDELAGAGAALKAPPLAAAVKAAGFDLVLTGAVGTVDGSRQLGVLLAEHLGIPCVTQAAGIVPGEEGLEIVRELDRGVRERVAAATPLVVTVAPAETAPVQASADARLRAEGAEVPVWDLADLGVPPEVLREAAGGLRAGPPQAARPRLSPIAAPDPSLPAFDRILKLVAGSVKRREGRVVRDGPDETIDQIFSVLLEEGWLDHLRRDEAAFTDPSRT